MDPDDPVGRLFLAVPVPDEVRHGLAAFLSDARAGKPLPGKPVPPENWHFTLRFLGQATALDRDKVSGFVSGGEAGSRFPLRLGGLGAFPRPARATVLWLGVEHGEERLADLARLAEEAAVAAGFPAEERRWHPHLTLSRIRPHQDVRPLLEGLASPPLGWMVDEIVLYRSHLGGGPARYEAVERFPLS